MLDIHHGWLSKHRQNGVDANLHESYASTMAGLPPPLMSSLAVPLARVVLLITKNQPRVSSDHGRTLLP